MAEIILSGGNCGGALITVTQIPAVPPLPPLPGVPPILVPETASVSENDTSGLVTAVRVDMTRSTPQGELVVTYVNDNEEYCYRADNDWQAVYTGQP